MRKHLSKLLLLVPIGLLLFWPASWSHNSAVGSVVLAGPVPMAAQATTHGVKLTWVASTTAGVGYNIYRGSVTGGPYTQIASGVSNTSYLDSTGTGGTTYYYVVTAVLAGVESQYSNEAHATFLVTPAAPTGLQAASQ